VREVCLDDVRVSVDDATVVIFAVELHDAMTACLVLAERTIVRLLLCRKERDRNDIFDWMKVLVYMSFQ